ncbi:salicylate carboxymethyltransferase-like [Durio zibethinus]|uniref:Salicylate carboxymethyltransferase-like n=1 Tax=Durio zibethinus TaxID=66656 RepID=A0A6P5ZIV2_DURZI|nr:salicylate carboxymethyltransferase-like [Durio zibethinus]
MEVVQVLHMKGGVGETSYANNSLLQQKVLSMTKPITDEAITELYCSSYPESIAIADLGCSSGPNTLFVVSELIKVVDSIRQKIGQKSPEYQVFLNDLPGNDFNTIFRSLPSFQSKLKKQLGAGSFSETRYQQPFKNEICNFMRELFAIQVPEGLESNKENIYMASTSPANVLKAYYEQFQQDFSLFLKCRSEELVAGGRMVLTFLGRKSDDPSSKECCYIWELMAMALNDLAFEIIPVLNWSDNEKNAGTHRRRELDSFNIPQYTPSPTEVKSENEFDLPDAFKDGGYNVANSMRAVAEPLLASHFGEAII